MKNLLFALLMLCCTSCTDTVLIEETESPPFNRIIHFEYNGHKYIIFDRLEGMTGTSGVVHDPNCNCDQLDK